jgi:hypothetical protein
VLIGAIVALVLIAGVVVAWQAGLLARNELDKPPDRLLVIAAAPDAGGGQTAAIIFELPRSAASSPTPVVVSPETSATIPGTSAGTLGEAYPFGGGEGVAQAYAQVTGDAAMDWVVLKPEAWLRLIDWAGGVDVEIPEPMNAYISDELVLVGSGRQHLSAQQAVAVASGIGFLAPGDRQAVRTSISGALSSAISSDTAILSKLAGERVVETSLSDKALESF